MVRALPLVIVCACASESAKPETANDSAEETVTCTPSFGNNCGCTVYCLTEEEIGDIRDLDCGESPNWTCEAVNGTCEIVR